MTTQGRYLLVFTPHKEMKANHVYPIIAETTHLLDAAATAEDNGLVICRVEPIDERRANLKH